METSELVWRNCERTNVCVLDKQLWPGRNTEPKPWSITTSECLSDLFKLDKEKELLKKKN